MKIKKVVPSIIAFSTLLTVAPVSSFAAEHDALKNSKLSTTERSSYIDVVQDRMKTRDLESRLFNTPVNIQEQIIDGWFLARFWIFKDQNNSHQTNRFISWFKNNLASAKGYDSIAEQIGLKIEAREDMDISNVQYTSKIGETIYQGISELTNTFNITQKLKSDSFQRDYTKSQTTSITNGLQLGFKVAAKGVVPLAGADFEASVTYNLSGTSSETSTISDKFSVPSQEVTLPPGHKAIIKHDLRKMIYSGTNDVKGDLNVTFDDKEIIQKFIHSNYKSINLSGIRATMIAIDEWNKVTPTDFYNLLGKKNYIKDGETIYIDTPAKFNFNGATPYYRATFTQYDENGKLVKTQKINEDITD
ncbi:toxin ETX/toxin MTX2 [Bacillus thuringiensis]